MPRSNTFAFLTVTLGILTTGAQAQSPPQVTLPGGTTLTGAHIPFAESQYLNVDTTLNGYKGIPYAEPPSGDLRFKKPVKQGPLGSAYDATDYNKTCHQKSILDRDDNERMSEDCLYLNVFTSENQVKLNDRFCRSGKYPKLPSASHYYLHSFSLNTFYYIQQFKYWGRGRYCRGQLVNGSFFPPCSLIIKKSFISVVNILV